jgi:hypothetical protein
MLVLAPSTYYNVTKESAIFSFQETATVSKNIAPTLVCGVSQPPL